ncbi:hypothetical protein EVAR_58479_1 [Eumeta japonica]|uniref:Uncharacterized protein n=1 Tax=Eumeta variegata TaxID=151549 RepID=A0A4C1YQX7_EUMVA|nr:hypothetical protein EVAR_58479_1 [Eumeta japonica]
MEDSGFERTPNEDSQKTTLDTATRDGRRTKASRLKRTQEDPCIYRNRDACAEAFAPEYERVTLKTYYVYHAKGIVIVSAVGGSYFGAQSGRALRFIKLRPPHVFPFQSPSRTFMNIPSPERN